jgi:hypothetical protein
MEFNLRPTTTSRKEKRTLPYCVTPPVVCHVAQLHLPHLSRHRVI